jgi:O-methyltransferase
MTTHPRSRPSIDNLRYQDGADEIYRALHRGVEYAIAAAVDGHIAEFGTSSGRTAMTLAKAMADFGYLYARDEGLAGLMTRKLLLFDGFEGFPSALHPIDRAAPHIVSGVWGPGVTKDANPETLLEMCAHFFDPRFVQAFVDKWSAVNFAELAEKNPAEWARLTELRNQEAQMLQQAPRTRVEIHSGWYSETLPKVQPGLKLAMVHIDCDFYASTMEVLDRLFTIDAFADGCAIYFDDWYCNRGSPDFGEQRAWADCVAKHRPRFSDWGSYATMGRRFIIHQ